MIRIVSLDGKRGSGRAGDTFCRSHGRFQRLASASEVSGIPGVGGQKIIGKLPIGCFIQIRPGGDVALMQRAPGQRVPGFEPATDVCEDMNTFPPAAIEGVADHGGGEVPIFREQLKIDEERMRDEVG